MTRIIVCIAIALVGVRPALADDAPPTAEPTRGREEGVRRGQGPPRRRASSPTRSRSSRSRTGSRRTRCCSTTSGSRWTRRARRTTRCSTTASSSSDAPPNAAQRATVDRSREGAREGEARGRSQRRADDDRTPPTRRPTPTTHRPRRRHDRADRAASTARQDQAGRHVRAPTDFQHQVVEDAPPGKPLDITAFVPEDSGFTVTLYYRGAGDATFTAKPMKWHYKELVARIPAAKMSGSSIQYYIEVKDQAGTVVTRSGKSTSPNLVNIDASARAALLPRHRRRAATGDEAADDAPRRRGPARQARRRPSTTTDAGQHDTPAGPRQRLHRRRLAEVQATRSGARPARAGVLLAGSLVFYIEAGKQATRSSTTPRRAPGRCAAVPRVRRLRRRTSRAPASATRRCRNVTLGVRHRRGRASPATSGTASSPRRSTASSRRRPRRPLRATRCRGSSSRRSATASTRRRRSGAVLRRRHAYSPSLSRLRSLLASPRARRTRRTSPRRRSCAARTIRRAPTASRADRPAARPMVCVAPSGTIPDGGHRASSAPTTATSSRTTRSQHRVRTRPSPTAADDDHVRRPRDLPGDATRTSTRSTITASDSRTSRSIVDLRGERRRRSRSSILDGGGIAIGQRAPARRPTRSSAYVADWPPARRTTRRSFGPARHGAEQLQDDDQRHRPGRDAGRCRRQRELDRPAPGLGGELVVVARCRRSAWPARRARRRDRRPASTRAARAAAARSLWPRRSSSSSSQESSSFTFAGRGMAWQLF